MFASKLRARALALVVVVGCLAAGAAATAAGDDRSAAESILKEVEGSARKDLAGELVARSRAALDRGQKLRGAGDETHARLADSLARTWAEAARDVAHAAVTEESAASARRGANDAGSVADRERALLEEAVAQSGRLRAQLESAPREEKREPARTSAAANSDAGTKPPPIKDFKDAGAPRTDGGAK